MTATALPAMARPVAAPLSSLPHYEIHRDVAVLRWRYGWPVWLVALWVGISRQDVRNCLADWREWAHQEQGR